MSVDGLEETFNIEDCADHRQECAGVTVWIPTDLKEKYDEAQNLSNKQFGKFIKKLVIKAIQSAKIEKAS